MINHSRPTIRKKDLEVALTVMISDKLATGDVIHDFERSFSNYYGKAYSSVFVSSGTAALYLILHNLGIREGDEVILSSYLNSSPLHVVSMLGATPVLVDICEDSYQMDMDSVMEHINENTKAIIVSHMFGNIALIDELAEVKIPVIEDASHGLGAMYKDKKVGEYGDYAYFSLSATRMITSGGAGGMILTRKKGVDAIRDIRHYDKKQEFVQRFNYHGTDLQAAIGIEEMKNLNRMINVRNDIATFYDSAIMESALSKHAVHDSELPSNYRYVCKTEGTMNINEIIEMFARHGVEVAKPVFKPLHQYLELDPGLFPNTENAFLNSVSIPIYPTLIKSEAELVAKLIRNVR